MNWVVSHPQRNVPVKDVRKYVVLSQVNKLSRITRIIFNGRSYKILGTEGLTKRPHFERNSSLKP